MGKIMHSFCFFFYLLLVMIPSGISANNITLKVFGTATNSMMAAFGDYNSDELTDLFVLSDDDKTVEVFVASNREPLLNPSQIKCSFKKYHITSVVPGDFDGDSKMDILVSSKFSNDLTQLHIHWGNLKSINCTDEYSPILKLIGQPLAIDYNRDKSIDLFGVNENGTKTFWIFGNNRSNPSAIPLHHSDEKLLQEKLKHPHAHAFIDLNADSAPDLFLSTENEYQIWFGSKDPGFSYNKSIPFSDTWKDAIIGQALFLDLSLQGNMDLLVPVCLDRKCLKSTIYLWKENKWTDLHVDLKNPTSGITWGFLSPKEGKYTETITLRCGDFNLDGFPDLLATLTSDEGINSQAFLMENVAGGVVERTFMVRWDIFSPFGKTLAAAFYDAYQDGILDVILAGTERMQAFRNTPDYDANFVKVLVQRGGGNLPGPIVSYQTNSQEGELRVGASAQLSQSAHFTLGLPYCIFGLGRTPNFVDTLIVGVAGKHREWTQIIPNSQMIVIPHPAHKPNVWTARLFLTPSKLILMSVAVLIGTCILITAIIAILYWQERREDRLEKLQEAHRFHFDAM